MDLTPNLQLPFIAAAQAQKHVTHNEALRALDAVVQLTVLDKDLASPPGAPSDGARYVVGASPTGAWSGQAGKIAVFQDDAWAFSTPREGWMAWAADEDKSYVYTGAAWVQAAPLELVGTLIDNLGRLGVNATADAVTKFVVAAAASLFNHAGAGHQVKVNKAAAPDTASFLFQTNFSGRAEMGTTGDDNFHFKVSADGLAWIEALLLNRMTGRATFPAASIAAGAQTATPFTIVGGANPASAGMQIETTSDAANCVFAFRDNSPGQGRLTVFNFINGAGLAVGSLQYQFNATGASQFMRLKVNDLEVMRWTGNTNVLIGGTADPAGASKALALFNGVAPTGSVADGVALYAEDVAGSSELKVRDEAGNVTTLSPHNFSRIPEGPSEPMAWAYHCERDGTTISVDMLKVVRLVERLAGERLVHERSEHKLTG